jgi:hypothetical protein
MEAKLWSMRFLGKEASVGAGRVSSTSSPVSMAVRMSAKCSCAYWALTFMGLG